MKEHLQGSFYNNNKNMQCLRLNKHRLTEKSKTEFKVIFQTSEYEVNSELYQTSMLVAMTQL